MKRVLLFIIVCVFMSLSGFLNAQTMYTYDFNSLTLGSGINGQDNWMSTYQTVSGGDFEVNYTSGGSALSPDNSLCLLYNHGGPGIGQTASRLTTPALPFDFSAGGIMEIEVKMLVNWWGVGFGWGYDATNNGTINFGTADANDGGCWFYLKNANNTNHDQHSFTKPDGTTINFTYDNSVSDWNVFRFSIDFTANAGAGAITMYAKTPTGTWSTISEVNSVNLGLTPGSSNKLDPAMWNRLLMHSQGGVGGFDDIVIRQYGPSYQYIVFESIPATKLTTDPPFVLHAYSNQGLPVSFTVTGPATITNDTVLTITGPGMVSVTAHQPGNGTTIDPATDVTQTFEAVNPLAVFPEVDIKNPVNGATVKNPKLLKIPLCATAVIDYPELLSISDLKFVIGGTDYTATPTANGYYICYWQPSTYGSYTGHVVATSTGGSSTTSPDFTFNVVQDSSAQQFVAINQVHMATQTTYGLLMRLDTTIVFPSFSGTYKKVTAVLNYDCPNDGCEPWDRVCHIMITGANGEETELFKYITPYGKACSDSVDVTDLVSQLQGKIHLTADFPAKSVITLTLKYHEGESPAKYSWVKKVWYDQYYSFGNFANQQSVEEKTVELQDTSDFYIHHAYLRIMSSGHNWGDNNTGNAAEFKEATHNIQVDGTTVYTQHLWQTCNPNPAGCNAQAGTWQYSRAGWCPGSIPILWRFDLSSYIHQDVDLNYQFDPTYIDYCSSSNPGCVTGSTCTDCTDPANPIIDVAADLISYFDVIPASVEELEIQMEVFPNPSNGVFTIETSVDFMRDAVVTVLDATGKTVQQFSWNGESRTLDLTQLSEGIYVLKVLSENGISVKKLIVE